MIHGKETYTMQNTLKYFFICLLLTSGLVFSEISFGATQSLDSTKKLLIAQTISDFNETDAFYFALNSKPGIRRQVTNSLDDIVNGQTEIKSIVNTRASKAGARHIIKMIDELSKTKIDKTDLVSAMQPLHQEMSSISDKLIAISSQLSPQQRIQMLAEIKTEQKHIKERLSEMNNRIQKINTQYSSNATMVSRDHQSDLSKIAETQTEINDIFSKLNQDIKEQKQLSSGHLKIIVFFFLVIISGIAGLVYFYINQHIKTKKEILEKTKMIVKEQYDHLIEQLYIEEHEDGRLTAEDLKKMSEQVKKRVVRQNWAKRKTEDRPAFI